MFLRGSRLGPKRLEIEKKTTQRLL